MSPETLSLDSLRAAARIHLRKARIAARNASPVTSAYHRARAADYLAQLAEDARRRTRRFEASRGRTTPSYEAAVRRLTVAALGALPTEEAGS